MDTYHGPHGVGLSFESVAGLSFPLVCLLSLDGVPDDDPFFRHTFLGVGFDLTSCNTQFIKRHKPSNHIRARIKSHVYTIE